ncbi:mandelate racemase/muconate lactonizing enzyme family protein [Roseibium aggregatum]|uniref:Mandelate racemase/muconate lactonizing enzyme family protein n=1 Tax=Roseibium aggregatum TaxID=187304 RepID=A0A939EHG8_9HYPH|nr:mandelate racemase/muconate lactonizing enzyme family protein [Roseibium aggregatum]MBN9672547.1 mandelate racemase/muconate lactonizing enzyme family protein [Roseibium aggregatum]
MPVIDRIELYFVKAPLPAPFAPSWMPGLVREAITFYLVRFVTDEGVEGWSAFTSGGRERAGLGDTLANLFLGENPENIDRLCERIHIMAVGGSFNWWLEPAFWDIKAKMAGLPLYKLLGGTHDRLKLYASGGELKDTGARREEAETRYAEGFETMKVRVHDFDEKVDIEHISDIALHMQGRMKISVDCNQAFRLTQFAEAPQWSLERAKRFVDAAADVGLAWVEEPLFGEWHEEIARLTAYSRVPIAGGELHVMGAPELIRMAKMGCYNIYQPDAMFAGGVKQGLDVAKACRDLGLKFTPHTWTNGFGLIVNAHVHAASGFADETLFEYPLAEPGWVPEGRDAIIREPFHHDRGWFNMPEAPGLGFEIDHEKLARYGRCFFKASRREVHWMPQALAEIV